MSAKRYTNEFKIEAVRQITECGYKVNNVAEWLAISIKILSDWTKKFGDNQDHQ